MNEFLLGALGFASESTLSGKSGGCTMHWRGSSGLAQAKPPMQTPDKTRPIDRYIRWLSGIVQDDGLRRLSYQDIRHVDHAIAGDDVEFDVRIALEKVGSTAASSRFSASKRH